MKNSRKLSPEQKAELERWEAGVKADIEAIKKQRKRWSHGSGFKRSKKEWEKTIASTIGKAIDRLNPIDALLYTLTAYFGYKAGVKRGANTWDQQLGWIAMSMLSLKLAQSPNLAAGSSGVVGLTIIGLANTVDLEWMRQWLTVDEKELDWWPFKSTIRKKLFIP